MEIILIGIIGGAICSALYTILDYWLYNKRPW